MQGLSDAERLVRIAAAKALFELLNRELPAGDVLEEELAVEAVPSYETVVVEEQPTTVVGALFKGLFGGGTSSTVRRRVVAPVVEEPADADLAVSDAAPREPVLPATMRSFWRTTAANAVPSGRRIRCPRC